jgi:hypothetical protein
MDDKLIALFYYEKMLKIEQKSLPSNQPTLVNTHYHIAIVLNDLHCYKEALRHAKQAVDIVHHMVHSIYTQMRIYQNYLKQLPAKARCI